MARRWRIGTLATDVETGLKVLNATVVVGNYDSLQSPEGTFYQVPVGKTFIITKISWQTDTAGGGLQLGYGDNSRDNNPVSPTNAKYMTPYMYVISASELREQSVYIEIPAQKYPFILGITGTERILVQGVEV